MPHRNQFIAAHVAMLLSLFAASGHVFAQIPGTVITFDVPGAGTGPNQGTFPAALNSQGDAAGNYKDSAGTPRAFVRYASGEIVTFEAPGAFDNRMGGTAALGINDSGVVAGYFIDSSLVRRGFIRDAGGSITPFDAPGVRVPNGGTVVSEINSAGVILGNFTETEKITTTFLRQPDGSFIIFDGPGTAYTNGRTMNSYSVTAGDYYATSGGSPAFVREASGLTYTFSVGTSTNIEPESINDSGEIVGSYVTSQPIRIRGFLRKVDGSSISIDAPTQATKSVIATGAQSINNAGMIVGYYETSQTSAAFLRMPDGAFSIFQIPDGQDTFPEVINANGVITGFYCPNPCADASRGFIIIP